MRCRAARAAAGRAEMPPTERACSLCRRPRSGWASGAGAPAAGGRGCPRECPTPGSHPDPPGLCGGGACLTWSEPHGVERARSLVGVTAADTRGVRQGVRRACLPISSQRSVTADAHRARALAELTSMCIDSSVALGHLIRRKYLNRSVQSLFRAYLNVPDYLYNLKKRTSVINR